MDHFHFDDDEEMSLYDLSFDEMSHGEEYGEDSVDEEDRHPGIYGPIRERREKEDKTRFVGKGTFTADEMVDVLEPVKESARSRVARGLFNHMTLTIDKKKGDDEKKKKKDDETKGDPSMWDYDSRRQPKEFVDLDLTTFLEEPSKPNLCFLEAHILEKICQNLAVVDFLNLSLTCRYLHWRMFTFCTCYAPYAVRLQIADRSLPDGFRFQTLPKLVYHDGWEPRGIFVLQPTCLKKPFFFNTIELELRGILYEKEHFDRCLPFILPIRKLTKELKVVFPRKNGNRPPGHPLFTLPDTNNFFETVKATSIYYRRIYSSQVFIHAYLWHTCPYTRKFNTVWVPDEVDALRHSCGFLPFQDTLPWDSCPNRFGVYQHPSDVVVKQTLQEFLRGSKDLDFHGYYYRRGDKHPVALLKYLFGQYKFEEYYWDEWECSFWTTTIETEGRRHKISIYHQWFWTDILVGREENFDKMTCHFFDGFFENNDREELVDYADFCIESICEEHIWKMETAIEPAAEEGREEHSTEEESREERSTEIDEPDRKRARHV